MMLVFVGEGLAMLGLKQFGHEPALFMVFAALTFLFWGEIYSIFPALVADTFGAKNAAANAGMMYTAKGTASLLVPLSAYIATKGDWDTVFIFAATISIVAGLAAKFVLQPMRTRRIEEVNARGTP
jgi:OFA family oxalate/formate antiporter-like MFS transporter